MASHPHPPTQPHLQLSCLIFARTILESETEDAALFRTETVTNLCFEKMLLHDGGFSVALY